MKKLLIGVGVMALAMAVGMTACDVQAAELVSEDRSYGWQDRAYFGPSYNATLQFGADSGATGTGDAGDAGAAAGSGATGGDSGNGDSGCSK